MARRPVSRQTQPAWDERSPASYRLEAVDGCAVVIAIGEIDIHTSAALREALTTAAETSDRIILDLSDVTFLDSTGIGVMVHALNLSRKRSGGSLCLVGPQAVVRRVLTVTRLNEVFPTYASVGEAAATSA
jgi:anti-sigma B factor antagonist